MALLLSSTYMVELVCVICLFNLMQLAASGMLVLGCVAEVRDFELVIALPNGLRGSVAITNISDAYTALLQRLASSDVDAADDVNGIFFHLILSRLSAVFYRNVRQYKPKQP